MAVGPVPAQGSVQVPARRSLFGCPRLVVWLAIGLRGSGTAESGRDYYDRKKAAGNAPMEAMRRLKRRLSDVVYRAMVNDAAAVMTGLGGHPGATTKSSGTGCHPVASPSNKSLPEPATHRA